MCFSHNAPLGSGQLHDSWYTGPRQQERRWGNQAFIKRQFKKKNKKLLTIYLDLEFVMVRNWILSQHKAVPWFNWLLNKYCFKKDLIRIIFSNIWYKLWDKAYNSRCITLYDVAVLHVFNKKLDYSPDQVFFPQEKTIYTFENVWRLGHMFILQKDLNTEVRVAGIHAVTDQKRSILPV